MSAKSRDSSILLFRAMARTISGRLCILPPDVEFSRAATASASGFAAEVRRDVWRGAARFRVAARMGVNRKKKIRTWLVGYRRPLFERHEDIGATRHRHFHGPLLLRAR